MLAVNTQEELSDLVHHYDADPSRVSVVSPGADIALYTPGNDRATERSRRELGVPLHAKVVAFVGRLQPFKGPQVLIHAVADLLERDPQRNLRVLICGGPSGPSATPETYRNLAIELGVDKRIRFLDPRPPEELVAVYRAADIIAVPSYNESFGLVAMEAQATGTPVVAARVGGLPVAVAEGETGLLVDGHDPALWADTLATLLDDDETRIRMGQDAVEHARNFSWAATATQLSSLYSEATTAECDGGIPRRADGARWD